MRQDPDVILIGEIRDNETAVTAMRAAMTGHQVFSTLHTNDAVSTLNRLLDIGVPAHMIAGSLNAIVAQRLIRKLCKYCKTERPITAEEYAMFKVSPEKYKTIFDEKGCMECHMTGFSGRTVITEVLYMTDKIRDLISNKASQYQIMDVMKIDGFVNMQRNGIVKIFSGMTSIKELRRGIDMTDYV